MKKPTTMTHNTRVNYEKVARIAHLYQAANILATPSPSSSTSPNPELARIYLDSVKVLAKKVTMRLDPSIKRTICKRCDSLLIPGVSATYEVENKSKNGKKPWADVLIVGCKACGALKRFPVGAELLKEKRTGKKYQLWSEMENSQEQAGKGKGGKGGKNGQQQQQKQQKQQKQQPKAAPQNKSKEPEKASNAVAETPDIAVPATVE